jgi:hypothetical protein
LEDYRSCRIHPQFTNPDNPNPQDPSSSSGTGTEQFLPPDIDEARLQSEALEQSLQEALAEVDAELLSLKSEIEKSLIASTRAFAVSESSVQEVGGSNIVGVGIGFPEPRSILSGLSANAVPGKLSLNVYTIDTLSPDRLLAEVASVAVPGHSRNCPLTNIPTGHIDAYNQRAALPPRPGAFPWVISPSRREPSAFSPRAIALPVPAVS